MEKAALDALLAQTQFEHMNVDESAIARAWVLKHASEFDAIDFNVRIGNAPSFAPDVDETTRKQFVLLSQKRADIVAQRGHTATIVEVKRRLALSALGQLLGYRVLLHLDRPDLTDIHLVAIAHSAIVDAPQLLHSHGVDVELFPNVPVRYSAP